MFEYLSGHPVFDKCHSCNVSNKPLVDTQCGMCGKYVCFGCNGSVIHRSSTLGFICKVCLPADWHEPDKMPDNFVNYTVYAGKGAEAIYCPVCKFAVWLPTDKQMMTHLCDRAKFTRDPFNYTARIAKFSGMLSMYSHTSPDNATAARVGWRMQE